MLDLTVYRSGDHFHWKPIMKRPAFPLSTDSAHPFHVHVSWPLACVRRYFDLSLCYSDFKEVTDKFMNLFIRAHAPHWRLRSIQNSISFWSSQEFGRDPRKVIARPSRVAGSLWFPLNYHPCFKMDLFRKGIGKLNNDIGMKYAYSSAFGHDPLPINFAWKRSLPRFEHFIQRATMAPRESE